MPLSCCHSHPRSTNDSWCSGSRRKSHVLSCKNMLQTESEHDPTTPQPHSLTAWARALEPGVRVSYGGLASYHGQTDVLTNLTCSNVVPVHSNQHLCGEKSEKKNVSQKKCVAEFENRPAPHQAGDHNASATIDGTKPRSTPLTPPHSLAETMLPSPVAAKYLSISILIFGSWTRSRYIYC